MRWVQWLALLAVAASLAADLPPPLPAPAVTRPPPEELVPPVAQLPQLGRVIQAVPLPLPFGPAAPDVVAPPGLPPRMGRPKLGTLFNPGASGPGIQGRFSRKHFLGGALDTETGWPFVLLDHYTPRPDRVLPLWVVQTRDCEQELGTDLWAGLRVLQIGVGGELEQRSVHDLLTALVGNTAVVQIQGNLTTKDSSLGALLWTHSWLGRHQALAPGTVVIAFDWPAERVFRNDMRDVNEKGRRAFVAAWHLARLLQAFPGNSHVTLLGQSYGGRVVTATLHLLAGGTLKDTRYSQQYGLEAARADLHLRAIVLAGAIDRHWLDPGSRLGEALKACEAYLNLTNDRDEALVFYPFLAQSGMHRAMGRVGVSNLDLERLGPLGSRYAERETQEELKGDHTLLDAVANPRIARWMAPYLWADQPAAGMPWPIASPSTLPSLRK